MKPFANSIASTLILLTTALLTGCDIGKGAVVEGANAVKAAINQVDKAGGAISGRNSAVEACTNAVNRIYPTASLRHYDVDGLNKFAVTFTMARDTDNRPNELLSLTPAPIWIICHIDHGKITEITKP